MGNGYLVTLSYETQKITVAQDNLNKTEVKILNILEDGDMSSAQIVKKLGLKRLSGGLKMALKHLRANNRIELTIPDKPKSPKQKYKIKTPKLK